MTGAEFMQLWENTKLRQYVVDLAKAFSKDMDLQEDLTQEAWMRICKRAHGKTTRYYMHEGFKAMDCYYHKERDGWRLKRWGKKHDTLRKRVRYKENKYRSP